MFLGIVAVEADRQHVVNAEYLGIVETGLHIEIEFQAETVFCLPFVVERGFGDALAEHRLRRAGREGIVWTGGNDICRLGLENRAYGQKDTGRKRPTSVMIGGNHGSFVQKRQSHVSHRYNLQCKVTFLLGLQPMKPQHIILSSYDLRFLSHGIIPKNETAPRKLEVGLQKSEAAFQNFEAPLLQS